MIVFATRNANKLVELRPLLPAGLRVVTVGDVAPELPDTIEDADTFAGNAIKKAREVALATGLPALADDSGLEVDALDGAPGVHSARYSGVDGPDRARANMDKLLAALAGVPPERRTARFRCVLALVDGPRTITTDGVVEGVILEERRGTGGFGYDPLFLVPSRGKTLAELELETKNTFSHRGLAMAAMIPHLATLVAGANSRGQ